MGRFMLLQSMYAVTGVLFFVRDLFHSVPMNDGIVNAFIWPYAQWPVIKAAVFQMLDPVIAAVQPVFKIFH